MNPLIETLAALQLQLDRNANPATTEQRAAVESLRAELPKTVLAYFDRRVDRGRKGVAWVRNGVCSSCHLRVAVGTVASLESAPHLVLCENCGSYLAIEPQPAGAVEEETVGSSHVTVRRVARRVAATELAVVSAAGR